MGWQFQICFLSPFLWTLATRAILQCAKNSPAAMVRFIIHVMEVDTIFAINFRIELFVGVLNIVSEITAAITVLRETRFVASKIAMIFLAFKDHQYLARGFNVISLCCDQTFYTSPR